MRERRGLFVGRLCWWVQPLGIVAELVAAALVVAPYSLAHNTISDLGAVGCGTVAYPAADVPVCSPAHWLLNGSLIVGGALLIVGAVLLRSLYVRSATGVAALVLWILSGVSSVLTGLVPLDVDLELHALVSLPAILLQPVALGLHALVLARAGSRWWWLLVGTACVVFVAAVFVLIRLEVRWGGLVERAAIWPVLLALPLLASASAPDGRSKAGGVTPVRDRSLGAATGGSRARPAE